MDGEHRHWRIAEDDVWVSEAATYAFCAKAWHLEHVLGRRPTSEAAQRRARGVHQHERHGERVARVHATVVRLSLLVAALAVLAAVLLLVMAWSM
ncbi:MAG: hypothetical protein ACJ79K_12415 [Gemmatimonadaceae bacterium]